MFGDGRYDGHQVGLTRSVVADDEDALVVRRLAELQLRKHQLTEQVGHPVRNDERLDQSARICAVSASRS